MTHQQWMTERQRLIDTHVDMRPLVSAIRWTLAEGRDAGPPQQIALDPADSHQTGSDLIVVEAIATLGNETRRADHWEREARLQHACCITANADLRRVTAQHKEAMEAVERLRAALRVATEALHHGA